MKKYIRINGLSGIHRVKAILDKGESGLWYKTGDGKWYPASRCQLTAETSESLELWALRHKGGD